MRIAAVLGAAGGIGSAVVEELLSAGNVVYLLDRESRREAVGPLVEAAGTRRTVYLPCELHEPASIEAAFGEIERRAGRLDVCVNAAGVIQRGAFVDVAQDALETLLAVNVRGAFQALQAASRLMIENGGGRIVCLTSVHGLRTSTERAAYALCKGAILSLSRALAVELAPHGILVNAVAPGPVSAGMQDADSDSRRRWQTATPLGRVAAAREVARAVAFLASPDNTFITGDTLVVDGGASVSIGG